MQLPLLTIAEKDVEEYKPIKEHQTNQRMNENNWLDLPYEQQRQKSEEKNFNGKKPIRYFLLILTFSQAKLITCSRA
jgi:hypothetical protein